ncbi:DHH family phosphoesterase, partial [uncultured Desulfovibrio sp.]|uniref:DHH family phosphoesterase n=1 Tax=uncultured Desulfovibrio sp. TaxID=167968 RepID=UPI00263097E5
MSATSPLVAAMRQWRHTLSKEERWCILIVADPDALAAAMALKRIMQHRVKAVDIMRVNEVTRPDNLAMIRYLHIPVKAWQPEKAASYDRFAVVDSQPHHHVSLKDIPFSLVIDHHPLPPEPYEGAQLYDVRPDVGATCSMMTRYLQGLRITPAPLLATAMLYGIRTDTAAFERSGGEDDFRAYQWLSRYADTAILRRILRSEYLREWLPLFSRAFRSLVDCRGAGAQAWLSDVSSSDLLVAVADFFTRVHGLRWIAVSGIVAKNTVVVIFRGDGSRDIGRMADACFYDVGSAGGHRRLARAEFPLSAVPEGMKPQEFVLRRLQTRKLRAITARPAASESGTEAAAEKAAPAALPAATADAVAEKAADSKTSRKAAPARRLRER